MLCQAFCPASATKVYYGGNIDDATASNGERYADSENAFAYRKALRADCTCNGRAPSGLAPVDLTHDTSLRPGDVVATTDGLVAFTGVRLGAPLHLTHSCYDPVGDLACGRCDSCVIRREGFAKAGVEDPTRYAVL